MRRVAIATPVFALVIASAFVVTSPAHGATPAPVPSTAASSAQTQTIAGIVTAATGGTPLANVAVTTIASDTGTAGPSGHTAANGHYSLTGFNPDTNYQVCFSGTAVPGGPRTGYAQTCLGNDSTPIFVLAGGVRRGVDAQLSVGGEISGRVTDTNGAPLAHVAVLLGPDPIDSHPTGIRTNADGTYALRGLDPGRDVVCFDPAEATGGSSPHGYAPECFDDTPFDLQSFASPDVPVDAGQNTSAINQALINHPTISGTVSGAAGAPLAGATVGFTSDGDFGDLAATAKTSTDGTYTLLWDGNESDRMCFIPPKSTNFGERCFDQLLGVDAGQGVRIDANQSFDVQPGTGTIVGTVTDTNGVPLGGVTVTSQTDASSAVATTASDGTYRLAGVSDAQGDTICFTPHPSTAPRRFGGYLATCISGVDHDSTAITTVNASLALGGTISGTVTDTSGTPLPGLLVKIDQLDSPYDGGGFATTDATGRYHLSDLPAGTYLVAFEADGAYSNDQSYGFYTKGPAPTGYQDQCWNQVVPYGTCTPITVHAGQSSPGISARLLPAGGVSGIVTDSAGHPLRDVRVDIVKGGYDDYEYTNAAGFYQGVLLPVGSYAVCITPQPQTTPAIPQGYQSVCYQDESYPDGPVTVTGGLIVTGIDIAVPATPSGTIAGVITDELGHPVAGAVVTNPNGDQHATSASNGHYVLSHVPAGDQTVCANVSRPATSTAADGYLDSCTPSTITVTAGLTTSHIDIQLTPAAEITGRITDSAGVPLRDVEIWPYFNGNFYPMQPVYTDSHGRYAIAQLDAGSYTLRLAPDAITGTGTSGFGIDEQWSGRTFDQSAAKSLTATAGQITTYNERMISDGSITGSVTDGAHEGFAGAEITMASTDGQMFYSAMSAADGSFTVNGIRPGRYTVCFAVNGSPSNAPYGATAPCYGDHGDGVAAQITVKAGAQLPGIDGSFVRYGALTVAVTDASNAHPLGEAIVTMTDASGAQFFEFSDFTTGIATLTGIVPGSYTVTVNGQNSGYPGGPTNGFSSTNVPVTITAGSLTSITVPLTAN